VHVFPTATATTQQQQLSASQKGYSLDPSLMQWRFLDRQLAEDCHLVEHLTVGDLLSLRAHLHPSSASAPAHSKAALRREVRALIQANKKTTTEHQHTQKRQPAASSGGGGGGGGGECGGGGSGGGSTTTIGTTAASSADNDHHTNKRARVGSTRGATSE
jgi:hypothetical protein